jgi:hypothetical protein
MNMSRKEAVILVTALVVTALGGWAAAVGATRFALVVLLGLVLGVTALQLVAVRRVTLRQEQLDRLEAKLDAVSRRVITESEALSRELGGQFDALAAELRDRG